jgi:hypothetical protein
MDGLAHGEGSRQPPAPLHLTLRQARLRLTRGLSDSSNAQKPPSFHDLLAQLFSWAHGAIVLPDGELPALIDEMAGNSSAIRRTPHL